MHSRRKAGKTTGSSALDTEAEGVAHWQNTCLACSSPWVRSQELQKHKETKMSLSGSQSNAHMHINLQDLAEKLCRVCKPFNRSPLSTPMCQTTRKLPKSHSVVVMENPLYCSPSSLLGVQGPIEDAKLKGPNLLITHLAHWQSLPTLKAFRGQPGVTLLVQNKEYRFQNAIKN